MQETNNREKIKNIEEELCRITDRKRVEVDVPMEKYTSFRAGGRAAALVTAESTEELKCILELLKKEGIKHILLGSGSNILVKDSGFSGIVIKLGENFSRVYAEGERICAMAGAKLSSVARTALEHSLAGFEFASGIPGSVGGGVFMNAGAYGGELKDIILSVTVVSADGEKEYKLRKEDLKLGYRHSIFQENGDIVTGAVFKLQKGNKEQIESTMKELMDKRNSKQPVNLPSAGSFFKRPEGHFAGGLIEQAGLKGLSVGKAQVSPLHAGFIVNNGGATASEIIQLMHIVQNTVFDKFGVKLEPEVRILGD